MTSLSRLQTFRNRTFNIRFNHNSPNDCHCERGQSSLYNILVWNPILILYEVLKVLGTTNFQPVYFPVHKLEFGIK